MIDRCAAAVVDMSVPPEVVLLVAVVQQGQQASLPRNGCQSRIRRKTCLPESMQLRILDRISIHSCLFTSLIFGYLYRCSAAGAEFFASFQFRPALSAEFHGRGFRFGSFGRSSAAYYLLQCFDPFQQCLV